MSRLSKKEITEIINCTDEDTWSSVSDANETFQMIQDMALYEVEDWVHIDINEVNTDYEYIIRFNKVLTAEVNDVVYIDFSTIIIDCSDIYFTIEPCSWLQDENMQMYVRIPHTEFLNITITQWRV